MAVLPSVTLTPAAGLSAMPGVVKAAADASEVEHVLSLYAVKVYSVAGVKPLRVTEAVFAGTAVQSVLPVVADL